MNALFTNTFLGLILGKFGDELDKKDDDIEDEEEGEKLAAHIAAAASPKAGSVIAAAPHVAVAGSG